MFKRLKPADPKRKAILDEAYKAQKEVLHRLEGREELEGVGIAPTEQGYSVKVNLSEPLPPSVSLPDKVGDVPVYVQYVDPVVAF